LSAGEGGHAKYLVAFICDLEDIQDNNRRTLAIFQDVVDSAGNEFIL